MTKTKEGTEISEKVSVCILEIGLVMDKYDINKEECKTILSILEEARLKVIKNVKS